MFSHVQVEEVRRIADLAGRAADAHRRLIGGLQDIDLGEQPLERGSRNPTDLDSLNLLGKTGSRDYDALRAEIGRLPPEARQEVKAAMLIGRGDFAAGDWDRAMVEAAAVPESADVDYLSEKLDLHDHLAKALYELKCL